MLCDKCKQNIATTHIKTFVDGVAKEYNLCEACAKENGYSNLVGGNFASILASMLGETVKSAKIGSKICPVCSSTFQSIAKNGKVGCSECYNTFKSELLPYIKRVHGSITHNGKTPNIAENSEFKKNDSISDLRAELNRLVADEKYEQAAIIRDKIKEMEAENRE